MEVFTNTPAVRRARKANLELILSNHDRSCLSCVRNRNCELQKLADKTDLIINHSPYKKQYSFDWVTYAQMMGLESMPACIDMGLSQPNYFMAGIDYEAIYGSEAAGMWMAGMEGAFVINPTNETSGEILLIQIDPVTGDTVPGPTMTYSNYTETSCTFNCPEIMIENVTGTLMTETVTVQSQGIAK